MATVEVIDKFEGEYAFLSNFSEVPGTPMTVEHYFQSCKTTDPDEAARIGLAATPGQAKKMGRNPNLHLKPNWEEIKDGVMLEGLRWKFSHPDLREKLLATGDAELIEGNFWGDTYWGVCNGVGKNMLGKLLMQVRDEINGNQGSEG